MPDGRHVASHGTDGRVLIWDARTLGQSPESGSGIVSWSRPGLVVAIGPGGDDRIRLWNPRDPNHPMEINPTDRVVSVAAMLPGERAVTGDIGGRLDLWNPADPDHPHELGTPEAGVWAIEVLPDGRFVTSDYTATIKDAGRSTKHRLCLWDPERPGHATASATLPVRAIAASQPDDGGRVILVTVGDAGLVTWDIPPR